MSAAKAYADAKTKLANFDAWVAAVKGPSRRKIVLKVEAVSRHPYWMSYSEREYPDAIAPPIFLQEILLAAEESMDHAITRARLRLVTACRQAHTNAANEARAIIAEDPPR